MIGNKHRLITGVVAVLCLFTGACALFASSSDAARVLALSDPAPDLVIEAVTWSPEIPEVDDTVTFTVTIKNQGGDLAGPSHAAYYIDDTAGTLKITTEMEPGATVTETFTWKARPGSHTIEVAADSNNEVIESDEINNTKRYVLSVLAPDLIIQDISWSPAAPSIRDKVTYTVTVTNQGNLIANCSHVELFIDNNSRGYQDIARLEAGATTNLTFPWIAQAGSHPVRAFADVLNKVNESNEINNDYVTTYATSAPDLAVKTISWSPETITENVTVTFTVTVENRGSGYADQSWLAFYIDGTPQTSVYIDRIAPGGIVTSTFTWVAGSISQTFQAVADSTDRVMESDESNNSETASLPSLAPDLIIQDITWSPTSPLIAHRVVFFVTLKNQGKTTAVDSKMEFIIDNYHKFQATVGELSADATATANFSWSAQSASHTVQAVADLINIVNESNEDNNTKTVTVAFSDPTPSADLTVQDITWSPAYPVAGDNVTFTASIKNQGTGTASPTYIAYYIDNDYQTAVYTDAIYSGAVGMTSFTWKARAGAHAVKAFTDINDTIMETDETNNIRAEDFSIAAPDLVIESVTWSPASPSIGDTVTFNMTIKNQGNAPSGRCRVGYSIDGSSRGYHIVDELGIGGTVSRVFTWTAQADSQIIRVTADIQDDLPESDESNNVITVTIPAPDLVIEKIFWSPEKPETGDKVTLTVILKNQGSTRAGAPDLRLYVDGSPLEAESLQDIDAGAITSRTFTWEAIEGAHTFSAAVDENNAIVETDEANNRLEVTVSSLPPISLPTISVLAPRPAMASTPDTDQPEAVTDVDVSSEALPGPDIPPVIQDEPSPAPAPWWQEKLLAWWPFIAALIVAVAAVTSLFKLRKKPAKE